MRVVRLLPDLRVLLLGVWRSVPPLLSVAGITAAILFVYGMIGWLMFADATPGALGQHRPRDADAVRDADARELPELHVRGDGGPPLVVDLLRQLHPDRGVHRAERPDRDRAQLDGGGTRGRAAQVRAGPSIPSEPARPWISTPPRRSSNGSRCSARRSTSSRSSSPPAASPSRPAAPIPSSRPIVNVLVLQHIACEPPGVFEDVLLERGATIAARRARRGRAAAVESRRDRRDRRDGRADERQRRERASVARRREGTDRARPCAAGLPFWGSCLGVQLLASSLGAKVVRRARARRSASSPFIATAAAARRSRLRGSRLAAPDAAVASGHVRPAGGRDPARDVAGVPASGLPGRPTSRTASSSTSRSTRRWPTSGHGCPRTSPRPTRCSAPAASTGCSPTSAPRWRDAGGRPRPVPSLGRPLGLSRR